MSVQMTETYKSTIMRRFQIFLLAIMLLSAQQAGAQKGLRVNDVFDGDVVAKDNMVVNIIKGERLAPYKLRYFRSLKFKCSEEERRRIEERVVADMKQAEDLEMERKGDSHDSWLYYAMMTLPPLGKSSGNGIRQWYLCYQCVPAKNAFLITLVFMEGNATMKEMRRAFNKAGRSTNKIVTKK